MLIHIVSSVKELVWWVGRCKLKPDLIINLGHKKRHLLLVPDTYDVKRKNKSHETIGTLSEDVFEQRTSTGSEAFSLFICLDANKLVLLSFFSLLKTIYPRVSSKPLPNDAKSPLPVDVRRSKTNIKQSFPWTENKEVFCFTSCVSRTQS